MIQACVIGLSKIGQIHCKNLIKIKKTHLSYIYDKNQKLCSCNTRNAVVSSHIYPDKKKQPFVDEEG